MNTVLAISGALGGFVAFGLAVSAIVRAIARMVSASRDNTEALRHLTERLDHMDAKVDQHSIDIARLQGRQRP